MSTKIEWTDETWNPVTGCTKVSQGCKHCYAERLWPKVEGARVTREGGLKRPFTDVRCHPERLDKPLRMRKPQKFFVNSMSDLFHEDVPDAFILQVFDVMRQCANGYAPSLDRLVAGHTFQILTKRAERMLDFCTRLRFAQNDERGLYLAETLPHNGFNPMHALRNVWLGVSIEDQETADERIPLLLQTPAAVRFISAEPLLGPIKLHWSHRLGWVITGGESGPHARPSHPDWHRSLRDQCAAGGVPFLFKQWGEWAPDNCQGPNVWQHLERKRARWNGHAFDIEADDAGWPDDGNLLFRLGKKASGRELDGRTHDEYPA